MPRSAGPRSPRPRTPAARSQRRRASATPPDGDRLFAVEPEAGSVTTTAADVRATPDAPVGEATVIYTDGACRGNPGPGGWAWAIPGGRWESGPDPRTTNQRMEITAVLEALRANDGPLEVWSDSTYVVNCFRDRWWQKWIRRDWRNAAGKPVANRDLWEPLIQLYLPRADALRFRWVKGHGADPVNAFVDERAVEASRTLKGATGTGAPQRG